MRMGQGLKEGDRPLFCQLSGEETRAWEPSQGLLALGHMGRGHRGLSP